MMTLEKLFRCGVRMLITGAALHGLSQMILADDFEPAVYRTSNASRGNQVVLISDEKAPAPISPPEPPAQEPQGRVQLEGQDQAPKQSEGPGVARVPACGSIARPSGRCTSVGGPSGGCTNGACTNGGCTAQAGGCGPNGCRPGSSGGSGANCCPSCRANRSVVSQGFGSIRQKMKCDWNDEAGNRSWSGNRSSAGAGAYSAAGSNAGSGVITGAGVYSGGRSYTESAASSGSGLESSYCPEHGRFHCPDCRGWWHEQWEMFNARNRQQGEILHAHKQGKLAYFHPMGNGGEGAPPFGCYHLVYAVDPNYFDPRDGQVYAAQGWGVPMAVPLAPTVRHTMNYSTGIPSSRLTPISNVVPPRRGQQW